MDEKNDHNVFEEPYEDNLNQAGLELDDGLFNEETAAEIMDDDMPVAEDVNISSGLYGWIGIALSVISFFIAPLVLSIAAIILGFVARSREQIVLGNVAIVIGVISIVGRMLFTIF